MRYSRPFQRLMLLISNNRRRSIQRRGPATKGFSLTEMLVAVAIMGLLIGVVGPTAMRQLQSSRTGTAEAQISQIRSALDIYMIDVGRYPNEKDGLTALIKAPAKIRGWNGPYLNSQDVPVDPWGGTFNYSIENGLPVIESLGADGVPGGDGDDADISA